MVFSSIRRRLSTTRTSARSSTTSSAKKAEPPGEERLILVYGNCQAHWLAGVLNAQGLGLVCVVGQPFGFYPQQRGQVPLFVSEAEVPVLAERARAAGRAVIMLEQTSPMNEMLKPRLRKLADRTIRFPHLELRAYWHPWLTKVGDGFAPARIQRQFAFDLAAIRRSEAKAGWTNEISDHIEARHAQALLFHTLNHPAGDLMVRLHQRICRKLTTSAAPLDRAAQARARRDITQQDGLHFIMEHPLHGAVIDALELEWARTGWYSDWQTAYFAAGAGHHKKALGLLESVLADPKHDPHVNYTLGILLEGLGDRGAALEAFGRAHRAYPQNPEYARRWLSGYTPSEAGEHPLMARLNGSFPG
jgi:hypothetical protein